ncbi:phosphoadenosine phosphosulfate reductase family protein [Paenibacillus sp. 276b]|uniref:phosphoadenosine phosphosulfate reductase domain-containing protein n=1 Tax=Paenibacillus sp. 276b TaxID=1566277 RepID=UPI001C409DF1|nr:phosphoadenosine phosphosulfate reductase family protein [Paenibacillus sp. 276b]
MSKITPVENLSKHNSSSRKIWRMLKKRKWNYFGTVRNWTSVFEHSGQFIAIHHFIKDKPLKELMGIPDRIHWSEFLNESDFNEIMLFTHGLEEQLKMKCMIPEQTFVDALKDPYNPLMNSPKHKLMLWFTGEEVTLLVEIFFNPQQFPPYGVKAPMNWPDISHRVEYETQSLFAALDYIVQPEITSPDAMTIEDSINPDTLQTSKLDIERIFKECTKVIVAYSGGKDSSVILQLCVEFVLEHPEYQDKLYIVSASTGVENPLIEKHIRSMQEVVTIKLDELFENGFDESRFVIVEPKSDQTYVTCVFGDGFIPPSSTFKWCVERLKVNPGREDLLERFSDEDLVCQVLGLRTLESSNRSRSIQEHFGDDLYGIHVLRGLKTAPPIRHWSGADVATYLATKPSPWNDEYSNHRLINIYGMASGLMECPIGAMIQNDNDAIKSCSGSSARFGCWACTVVKEDHSLKNLVEAYPEELGSYYKMRSLLKGVQDIRYGGCSGYYRNHGGFSSGYGDLTIDVRINLLRNWWELNIPLPEIEVIEIIKKVKAREVPEGLAVSNRFWDTLYRFLPVHPGINHRAMYDPIWEPNYLRNEDNKKVKLASVGIDRVTQIDLSWIANYKLVSQQIKAAIDINDCVQIVLKNQIVRGEIIEVQVVNGIPKVLKLQVAKRQVELPVTVIKQIKVTESHAHRVSLHQQMLDFSL